MIDIAIVGGGLCGLALADRLAEEGRSFHLYEARAGLGGRIRSLREPESGLSVDVGPSWFWPETQPRMAALTAALGLATFPQHDRGTVLQLTDPEKGPESYGTAPIHAGAMRVVGGLQRLVSGLAARLPEGSWSAGHKLNAAEDRGDHVLLTFDAGDGETRVAARQVVLALPPRLLAETVAFTPGLSDPLFAAMQQTETWMAAQAKAVMIYPASGWRDQGFSGNAFVAHERAVLAEVFDQSDPSGTPGALGGFLALDPEHRARFAAGLPMLVGNQLAQIFGPGFEGGPLIHLDWSTEPFTCSALDRTMSGDGRRHAAHPLLRRAIWDTKLRFAGSETARAHPGHVEGALDAADRVAGQLLRSAPVAGGAGPSAQWDLAVLGAWFEARGPAAFAAYRQALNRHLSRQDSDGATRRAANEAMTALFDGALDLLAGLEPGNSALAGAGGRAAAIDGLKPMIRGMLNRLIGEIMGFNRSSCALRNFPDEHSLPEPYVRQILQDASLLGRDFLNEADAVLAAAGEAT